MPVEAKDIIEYIGIDLSSVESVEDAKKAFDAKFTTLEAAKSNEELVNSIFGKKAGELDQLFRRTAKESGVEFEEGELADKKLKDIIPLAFTKLKTKYESQIEELKGAGGDIDAKVKEWQDKIEKYKQENSEMKTMHKTKAAEWEAEVGKRDAMMKEYKLGIQKSSVLSKLKLKSQMSDIEKKGFESLVNEKYKFDFDETGEFIVLDGDGKRIQSKEKAGLFASPEDALTLLAKDAGVLATNPHGGGQASGSFTPPAGGQGAGDQPIRKLAPAYEKAMGRR